MPRPRNKEDLIIAATTNYEKLLILIESRTESEKSKKNGQTFARIIG